MNELGDLLQNHWYELGSLLVQLGFLVAGVWFAGKILKGIRTSQEQMGALLKLSLSGEASEEEQSGTLKRRPTPYLLDGWPAATEPAAPFVREQTARGRQFAGAWSSLATWLQTPMGGPGPGPFRKVVRWLQTPAGT